MSTASGVLGCRRESSWSCSTVSIVSVGDKTLTYNAVSMYPGEMQFTRIPAPAHSTAKLAAKCRTAAFAALYGACGCGTLTMEPDMLPIMTMLPGAFLSMRCFATATAYRYVPSTLTPHSFCMRSWG